MSVYKSVMCIVGRVPRISQSLRRSLNLQMLAGSARGSRLSATGLSLSALQTSRSFSQIRPVGSSFLSSSYGIVAPRRFVQTKSDTEMSEFLKDEIQAEKESLKATGKAVQVKGFDVTTNEAEVTLKKSFQGEQITVLVNVNHAVDADAGNEGEMRERPEDSPQMDKMVCRPNFSVEIEKGDQTLAFNCSLVRSDDEDGDDVRTTEDGQTYQDQFNIDEFSIYKGEFKDSTYLMSGEVMDGNFYDNLMNMLDERGVNSDFVKEVTDFCTLYEQKLYVNLLEHLQDIVNKSK